MLQTAKIKETMNKNARITTLEQLIERIAQAESNEGRVSLQAVLVVVGKRSFAPILLMAGLVISMPIIGDIPGVPSIMGILVILTAGQMILGREHFWLPDWLLQRTISHKKLCSALEKMRRPARFFDRFLKERLTWLVKGIWVKIAAIVCMLVAAATPLMEFVPFSANGAGFALSFFGLALIAHDGLIAVIAFAIVAITLILVGIALF